jgi:hypothetical protein
LAPINGVRAELLTVGWVESSYTSHSLGYLWAEKRAFWLGWEYEDILGFRDLPDDGPG